MITALTHRSPEFLKAAYACPTLTLTDDERHIRTGAKYLSFDESRPFKWRVWRMSRGRVPIPLGAFPDLGGALYVARR